MKNKLHPRKFRRFYQNRIKRIFSLSFASYELAYFAFFSRRRKTEEISEGNTGLYFINVKEGDDFFYKEKGINQSLFDKTVYWLKNNCLESTREVRIAPCYASYVSFVSDILSDLNSQVHPYPLRRARTINQFLTSFSISIFLLER